MNNDFLTLEKKCKRYRMKKLLKFLLPIFIFILLGFSSYVYYLFKEEITSVSPQPSIKKKAFTPIKKIVPEKKVLIQKKVEPKKSLQKAEVKPIKKFKDVAYTMQIDKSSLLHIKEKPKVKKSKLKQKKEIKKSEVKKSEVKNTKSASFEVLVKKYDNLKQMENMYKKEKKYSLALKIGEEYFKKKKYSKALKWSKEANILNHKAEGAWLLYAKSEYAKGNTKRAIKLLKLYLGNAQSLEVESLLSEWLRKQR